MRAFDLIFAMTRGGPLDSSNVLPLFSYQFSFQQFHFGIGAAIGTFAFLIVFAVALAYVRTLNREAPASERGANAGCRADRAARLIAGGRRRALSVSDLLDVHLRPEDLGGDLRQPADAVSAQPVARRVQLRVRARERAALSAQQPDDRHAGHGADRWPWARWAAMR